MSDDESSSKRETASKMKQRHKKELQDLRKKVKAEVDGIPNAKRKEKREAKDKGEQAEKDLLAEHIKQLEQLKLEAAEDGSGDDDNENGDESHAASETKQTAAEPAAPAEKKPSRAQKKKAAKKAKEQARQAEIAEEFKNVVNEREVENTQLAARLKPLGFTVKEILSDGHCLFRAIADQIDARGSKVAVKDPKHTTLRKLAAEHIRAHPAEFSPFITDDEGELLPPAEYHKYCDRLASEADPVVWGGHSEIVALSAVLKRPINIHSATAHPYTIDTYHGQGVAQEPLHISFHRHYYGLGEHYNSIVDVPIGQLNEDDEAEAAHDEEDD